MSKSVLFLGLLLSLKAFSMSKLTIEVHDMIHDQPIGGVSVILIYKGLVTDTMYTNDAGQITIEVIRKKPFQFQVGSLNPEWIAVERSLSFKADKETVPFYLYPKKKYEELSVALKNYKAQDTSGVVYASYPGGVATLHHDIVTRMQYPSFAVDHELGDKIYIHCQLDETGKILALWPYLKGSDLFQFEAMKTFLKLETFYPETKNGVPQACIITLPFNFQMN